MQLHKSQSHRKLTGEYLAEVFVKLLDDYGLLNSLFTITCDNAANMTKMVEYIERASVEHPEITFKAGEHNISCIDHIIRLSVQAFLKKGLKSEPLEDIDDAFSTENMQHDVLSRLRRGIIYIRGSPQCRQNFLNMCLDNGLEPLNLVLDDRARWNSTFYMLSRALQLKDAYNAMPDMNGMKMDSGDWLILEALANLLGSFDKYSKLLSGSAYSTINQAMPICQRMLKSFEDVKQIQGMLIYDIYFVGI
jgi:hypothetical protein